MLLPSLWTLKKEQGQFSFFFFFFWPFLRPFLAASAKRFKDSILTKIKIMQQQPGLSHPRVIWSSSSYTHNIPRQAVNGPIMEIADGYICLSDGFSCRHRVHNLLFCSCLNLLSWAETTGARSLFFISGRDNRGEVVPVHTMRAYVGGGGG